MLRLVENAKRRYHELKQEEETNGVVPDPNHHNVINLSSSDEYSDDDLFGDDPSAFDLDKPVGSNTTGDITSRYFAPPPSPGYYSGDDVNPGSTASGGTRSRKRQPSKRPARRKNGSSGGWKAKAPKSRAKTGDRASRGTSAPRKTTAKAKTPKSTIAMMPI